MPSIQGRNFICSVVCMHNDARTVKLRQLMHMMGAGDRIRDLRGLAIIVQSFACEEGRTTVGKLDHHG